MKSSINLNFVVALSAEAHPIINHYKLKRLHHVTCFEVYKNENVHLIVGGIGAINAAIATSYLAGLFSENAAQVWFNVGIAGGNSANIGDVVLANAIVDSVTGKIFYPSICFDCGLQQTKVVTVGDPNTDYTSDALFDMEAAGFFVAANRFTPVELIHCCKVISDNSEQSVEAIDKRTAIELMQAGLEKIDVVVKTVMDMADQVAPDALLELTCSQLVQKHHFTESQKHSLRLYLQNWFALTGKTQVDPSLLINAKDAKSVLKSLRQMLDSIPVSYNI